MTFIKNTSFFSLLAVLFLSGCSRYSIFINENIVYEPPALFSDYHIADTALKECIRSIIAEQGLTKAEQLTRVVCGEGEISQLNGIEIFSNIEFLGFARNSVTNIAMLSNLKKLKQLDASNNKIQDFSVLSALNNLVFINSFGNKDAVCSSLPTKTNTLKITIPKHCR